jgi:hypothetical protein
MKTKFLFFIFFCLTIYLTQPLYAEESQYPESADERRDKGFGSIFGKNKNTGQFTVFGKSIGGESKQDEQNNQQDVKQTQKKSKTTTLNTSHNYLWQSALESIQFMPILVSDSNGGVLSTDWYENSDFPTERYKFNILIKSQKLKAKSLHVNAFKQVYEDGRWKDTKVSPSVADEMKDKILSTAQEMSKK